MTADELRRLAVLIERTDHEAIDRAAAYLRACADVLDAGPVAWRYWNEKSKSWNETSSASVAAAMQEGGRSVEPLYPLAMPGALRLPEPMTDSEVDHYGKRALMGHLPVREMIRAVEAETLRRVKEANNG